MKTPDLTKIISEPTMSRDAVHVAIAAVFNASGRDLMAGEHIALVDGTKDRVTTNGNAIGIVSPFLAEPVRRGQRFWMVLYPNTITDLKHVWSHPAFK